MTWKLQIWMTMSTESKQISISPIATLFTFFPCFCQIPLFLLFWLIFCYLLYLTFLFSTFISLHWQEMGKKKKNLFSSLFHLLFSYWFYCQSKYFWQCGWWIPPHFLQKQSNSSKQKAWVLHAISFTIWCRHVNPEYLFSGYLKRS